nr:TPA_asm: NADH dehydrogenase subunit 4L [Pseudomyrmex elongatus]
MFYDYLFSYIFFISLILIGLNYKYMLIVLLMIELIVFNLSMFIGLYMSFLDLDFFMIYYLVFSLCESVLGMSLLVLIVRFYGSEMYSFMNFTKFYDKINFFYYINIFGNIMFFNINIKIKYYIMFYFNIFYDIWI